MRRAGLAVALCATLAAPQAGAQPPTGDAEKDGMQRLAANGPARPGGSGVTGDVGPDRDLGTASPGALGQGRPGGDGGDIRAAPIGDPAFRRLDANHNGSIDRAEAEVDAALAAGFAQADRNRDGSVDPSEFQAFSGTPP